MNLSTGYSDISKFANDTKISRIIRSDSDAVLKAEVQKLYYSYVWCCTVQVPTLKEGYRSTRISGKENI